MQLKEEKSLLFVIFDTTQERDNKHFYVKRHTNSPSIQGLSLSVVFVQGQKGTKKKMQANKKNSTANFRKLPTFHVLGFFLGRRNTDFSLISAGKVTFKNER